MKRFILAGAACALSAAAAAQTGQPAEQVTVRAMADRFAPPAQLRNMWYDEFDLVKGDYTLSDGRSMQLSTWGNRMYARVEGIGKLQLVALSPYEFVALGKPLRIVIDDPETSSAPRITATVTMPAHLLSDAGPAGALLTLLAHR